MRVGWVFLRARSELRRRWRACLLLALGFAITALSLGAYRLSVQAAAGRAAVLRQGAHVIAYLRDDVDEQRAQAIQRTLGQVPGVLAANLVSPEEALARLQGDLADAQGLFAGLEQGFLPRSVEVTLSPVPGLAEKAKELALRLQRVDGVAESDVVVSDLERLTTWSTLGRWSSLGLLGLALFAALSAVAASFWAGRSGRREESRVLEFLGLTKRETVLPATLAGAFAAAAGAGLGLLALFAGWYGVVSGASARLRDVLGPLLGAVAFLPAQEWAAGVAAAALLGAVVARRSARFRGGHEVSA